MVYKIEKTAIQDAKWKICAYVWICAHVWAAAFKIIKCFLVYHDMEKSAVNEDCKFHYILR